ncbi:hypothetical protein Tco_0323838 [Tanacetum coccineum]
MISFTNKGRPLALPWGRTPRLDSGVRVRKHVVRGCFIPLAGVDDQARSVVRVSHGDQNDNIKNFGHDDPNEESGDADQEDRSKGNDHVGQDETATILVDAEVQATAADKPKGKRKKRRATGGASCSNLHLKRLREDYGTSSNVSASIAATMPFITSFVTPRVPYGPNCVLNIQTERILSSVPPSSVMTVAVTTTVTTGASSTLVLGAGTELATQVYQSLFADSAYIDSLLPLQGLFSQLAVWNMNSLFAEFNVERTSSMPYIKVASLESERDGLIDQVSLLETTCSRICDQVSGYELFKEQCEAVQDEQTKELTKVTRLKNQAIEESKDLSSLALDELIGNLKVHEVVMEKDSKIYRGKKKRIKSIALKAKKESSDDETSASGSDDEEYAMVVRNFKKFFRRKGKFVRQPREEKKSFRQRDEKKGRVTENVLDTVTLNSSYYSNNASSLDNDSMQIEYDSLCEISLKIINKNKFLNAKRDLLGKEILELNVKIKKLERSKEIEIACKSWEELKSENARLKETQVKFVKFDKSANSLREMLDNQKSYSCKVGLGFDSNKASTSGTKPITFVGSSAKKGTDGSTLPGYVSRTDGEIST